MVAIALYRGNLHRVPNAPPRRWPAPPRSISVGQFKSLLRRRSISLSRIAGVAASSSAPNVEPATEAPPDDSNRKVETVDERIVEEKKGEKVEKEEKEEKKEDDKVCDLKDELEANNKENTCEKLYPPVKEEISKTDPAPTEREERKKELEKKLEDLNQKKHNLVQMLKQILNAEEEIKRRSSQPPLTRGPVQGPMENGHLAMRLNVDVNFNHDLVGESDPGSTQSAPTRPFHQFHSPSPSSLSRSPFVHNQRGQLGHASSLPPLLPLPGNVNNNYNNSNYVSSSPSPAASGGTSVFRDNSRFFGGPN